MNKSDSHFWPYKPRTSIVLAIVLLLGLLVIVAVLKATINWPGEKSETAVLIGVLVFSLLPVLLALLDVIIERGGVIEYGGVKINFSQVSQMGMSGFTVPTNIGVPGQAIGDSGTPEILDALKHATACEIIVIDLEEGQAWWETRLLVLLAGAARLGKPHEVVFIGKDGGIDGCFQGWGYSWELLPQLLKGNPQYLRSYHAAQAAGRQWELIEPVNPPDPTNPAAVPLQLPWMQAGLATMYSWKAFDASTGLPNPLLAEQLLAYDLGQKIEKEAPQPISIVRLNELFKPVLYKSVIDTSWPAEKQMAEFFDSDFDYLAITHKGKYLSLTSRLSVLNVIVRGVVEKTPME